ncbi:phosphonate metabolism protein/1,5-bisphosphokinase (PRPP-forming) PhnN [Paracoccus aeridis]|uniref:phosphonate metabolism protein/1,5-bisphosphokinase (PRPP-forming) PhnN n=1 Tax=Paracoccus aeridis TaxID=1966466 RepID=UPI0010A9CC93|nr:phosphonate metabolism protein/1,5-bisphosphokinase (PRPP-forming) PhnN [Paracoccus aeridis]
MTTEPAPGTARAPAPAPCFAFVGPSGAGKDSVMAAVARARPDVLLACRVVTRPPDPTEPFEAATRDSFDRDRAAGRFVLDWDAHGLSYGIPREVRGAQAAGRILFVNLSRAVLPQAVRALAPLSVVHVTARPDVLARRLSARGREDADAIGERLLGADTPLPSLAGTPIHRIDNSGPLDHAVQAVLALLPAPSDTSFP